ncbi:hypothetical protein NQ318_015232 [Aromia moschata]|uniref:PiggyBac transposable element-derived protein 4 C-terminal zinc-ribbon domain-containing protein n=1 Tax=Aromia moschata TaxID=1265417 RepID=A0AAV8XL38_9CUCU|nr:hypothetical protein NQ318_015232 [Aromia moschata]
MNFVDKFDRDLASFRGSCFKCISREFVVAYRIIFTNKKPKPCVSNSIRLTASSHQPIRTTRRRCAMCSTKNNDVRTNWQCSVCNVPLCLGKSKACFQSYHRI